LLAAFESRAAINFVTNGGFKRKDSASGTSGICNTVTAWAGVASGISRRHSVSGTAQDADDRVKPDTTKNGGVTQTITGATHDAGIRFEDFSRVVVLSASNSTAAIDPAG
jgi:hypothetical protein